MTDKEPVTEETQGRPCDAKSWMEMMEEMMGRRGCDCSQMMSGMMSQAGEAGFSDMMSQMMAMCCRVPEKTEETSATEADREA